ncbi:hypothetical protein ACQ1Z6_15660, partial [Enterococcus faecalis]
HLEFRRFFGNAGTGTCQRGAIEHGCEFAPVAGKYGIIPKFLVPLADFMLHPQLTDSTATPSKHRKDSLQSRKTYT